LSGLAIFLPLNHGPVYVVGLVIFYVVLVVDFLLVLAGVALIGFWIWALGSDVLFDWWPVWYRGTKTIKFGEKPLFHRPGPIVILAVLAALYGAEQLVAAGRQSQDNTQLVQFYCQDGSVSQAEVQGCEAHVTAAHVNELANENDQTAIDAENQLSDAEDAASGQ
jgi:hypothetical protein